MKYTRQADVLESLQKREENIRAITEQLEEAFADNEEYLAVLGEAIYQYHKVAADSEETLDLIEEALRQKHFLVS